MLYVFRVRTTFWALACLLAVLSADRAAAQTTVLTPDITGDQLLFFYDARPGRVPFLSVSNPASVAVKVEIAFYNESLDTRLGQENVTIEVRPPGP